MQFIFGHLVCIYHMINCILQNTSNALLCKTVFLLFFLLLCLKGAIFSHLSPPICSQQKPQSTRRYHWLPAHFDNPESLKFWFKLVGLHVMRPLPKFGMCEIFANFFLAKIGNIRIHKHKENNNKKAIINNSLSCNLAHKENNNKKTIINNNILVCKALI